jgi:hypothetical protein
MPTIVPGDAIGEAAAEALSTTFSHRWRECRYRTGVSPGETDLSPDVREKTL